MIYTHSNPIKVSPEEKEIITSYLKGIINSIESSLKCEGDGDIYEDVCNRIDCGDIECEDCPIHFARENARRLIEALRETKMKVNQEEEYRHESLCSPTR